jgi:hypothetical protein
MVRWAVEAHCEGPALTILAATTRADFGVIAASQRVYQVELDAAGRRSMEVRGGPPSLIVGDRGVIAGTGAQGIARAAWRLISWGGVSTDFVLGGLQMWIEGAVPLVFRDSPGVWPSSVLTLHRAPSGVSLNLFEVGPEPKEDPGLVGHVTFSPILEGFYGGPQFAGWEGLNGPEDGSADEVAEYMRHLVTLGLREESRRDPSIPAGTDAVSVAIVDAAGARLA